jgi:hypothetical protein
MTENETAARIFFLSESYIHDDTEAGAKDCIKTRGNLLLSGMGRIAFSHLTTTKKM